MPSQISDSFFSSFKNLKSKIDPFKNWLLGKEKASDDCEFVNPFVQFLFDQFFVRILETFLSALILKRKHFL